MVRTYKRKNPPVNKETLLLALAEIRNGASIKGTSRSFGLNRSLLQRHLKGKVSTRACQGSIKTVFSSENEEELVLYCINSCERCYGLSRSQIARLAYQLAIKNNIKHPFNDKTEMAGRAWVEGFLKRHPQLAFRKPAHMNMSRSFGFTKEAVDKFFNNLELVITENNIEAHRIFNIDECGCSVVPNQSPNIIAPKDMKHVNVNVPAERGQLVSMVCACNPTGHFIPPMFIFARVRGVGAQFIRAGPEGCVSAVSKEAYMTGTVFLKYLQHFTSHVKPTQESPVLIVMDNHVSHLTINVIDFCVANHIVVVTLPPHTSHKLQPLDLIFFSILKLRFGKEWWDWMCKHPGQRPRDTHIPELMKSSYNESASIAVAANSFRKSGIWDPDLKSPNRNIFTERDFAASQLQRASEEVVELEEPPLDVPDNVPCSSHQMQINHLEGDMLESQVFLQAELDEASQPEANLNPELTETQAGSETTFTSSSSFGVSPYDIAPRPSSSKSANKPSPNASRKQFSEILTSPEYRQRVVEKANKKALEVAEKTRKKAEKETARDEKRKQLEEKKVQKKLRRRSKLVKTSLKSPTGSKIGSRKKSPDITEY